MKQAISVCLGVLILAAGILFSDVAWGQDFQLPPDLKYAGEQRPSAYHGRGRATFTALKVGQSPRASGMGDAFTAVGDDINAIFWNPAGLTRVERFEYAFSYTRWMVKSRFLAGAIAGRFGQQTIGLSLIQFDGGSSPETTPQQPEGTGRMYRTGDIFLKMDYARKMTDKLSLGVSAKWTQETLDQDKFNSVSFDFSSLFYTGLGSSRIAMTLRNFGKDQELKIPGSLLLGTSVAQPLVYTIAVAMEPFGRKGDPYSLTVAAELVHEIDDRERMHFGAELWLANTLALRAGYRGRYDLGDWSLGAGVQRAFKGGRRIGVDFSYVNFGNLFNTQLRMSLTGAF